MPADHTAEDSLGWRPCDAVSLSPVTGVTDRRGFTPTELVAFGCNGLLSFRTRHQLCCSHLCTGSLGKCLLPGDLSRATHHGCPWLLFLRWPWRRGGTIGSSQPLLQVML